MRTATPKLAAALLLLAACSERPQSPVSLKEGDPMTPNATAARPSVPPIDLELPARLETATFALG